MIHTTRIKTQAALIGLIGIFAAPFVVAQDLGDEQINVVKDYKPALSQAIKITDIPSGDTGTYLNVEQKYAILEISANNNFVPSPIKPVKIKDDNIKNLQRGFIKAGYGLEKTSLIEAYYNSLRSKDFNAGFSFRHLSTNGKINDYGFPGASDNRISLFGKKFMDKAALNARVNFQRDVHHFYGFKVPPDLFSKKETRHVLNTIETELNFESYFNNKTEDPAYKVGMEYYNTSNNFDLNESHFGFKGMLAKRIDDHNLRLAVDASLNKYESKLYDTLNLDNANNVIRILPSYMFKKRNLMLVLGLNVVNEKLQDSELHLYPHAELTYNVQDAFVLYGKFSGNIQQHSLYSISRENPFIGSDVVIGNTNRLIDLSGGVAFKIGHDLNFHGRVNIWRSEDQMFYQNNAAVDTFQTYALVYDDANAFEVHASLSYDTRKNILLSFNTDYYNVSVDTLAEPWYTPQYKFTLRFEYRIKDKIIPRLDWYYSAAQFGKGIDGNSTVKLKPYHDLNLSVDYRYSKNLSVFVQLNNMFAQRYFSYYQYPSYRINALAGLTFSF
ncbi:MAG TPA: hypothetical protein PKH65_04820 [Bacteroidia bacterium]|nr:hypothetical protein [Bacteroidia bacterium]